MISPLKIPRGVANLFAIGMAEGDIVNENTQFRPDFLNNDIRTEIINNWMTNISPISLEKKQAYIFVDVTFISYFGK